jgi:hypothetical protein
MDSAAAPALRIITVRTDAQAIRTPMGVECVIWAFHCMTT